MHTAPAHTATDQKRYTGWLENERGAFALERCQTLLRCLLYGWPRRSRSVLVMGAGSGFLVENLWEAGFDVTAQDSGPDFLALARRQMGARVDFVLSSPDHLPFDNAAFDYTVAAGALEFWQNPEAVLDEIDRVTTSGVILLFPNKWSLFGLECLVRRKDPLCVEARPLLHSPREVAALAARAFGTKKRAWASVLPGFSFCWGKKRLCRYMNAPKPRFPVGAFAGMRIDFGPVSTGTPLVLRAAEPVPGVRNGLVSQLRKG